MHTDVHVLTTAVRQLDLVVTPYSIEPSLLCSVGYQAGVTSSQNLDVARTTDWDLHHCETCAATQRGLGGLIIKDGSSETSIHVCHGAGQELQLEGKFRHTNDSQTLASALVQLTPETSWGSVTPELLCTC